MTQTEIASGTPSLDSRTTSVDPDAYQASRSRPSVGPRTRSIVCVSATTA